MYGPNTAILPATGVTTGLTAYAATGLGMVTVGIILIAVAALLRRHKGARP